MGLNRDFFLYAEHKDGAPVIKTEDEAIYKSLWWWLVFLPEIIAFVFYLAIFIIEYVSRYRVSKYINGHFGKRK